MLVNTERCMLFVCWQCDWYPLSTCRSHNWWEVLWLSYQKSHTLRGEDCCKSSKTSYEVSLACSVLCLDPFQKGLIINLCVNNCEALPSLWMVHRVCVVPVVLWTNREQIHKKRWNGDWNRYTQCIVGCHTAWQVCFVFQVSGMAIQAKTNTDQIVYALRKEAMSQVVHISDVLLLVIPSRQSDSWYRETYHSAFA